jgi:hypothetical protein
VDFLKGLGFKKVSIQRAIKIKPYRHYGRALLPLQQERILTLRAE